jgi:multicomponent Na+:H+ antiporter subunit B
VTPRLRLSVFLAGAIALAPLLLWGLAGLPRFGGYEARYGLTLNREEVRERKATDVVTSVVFDYRGADTMGEEFILFAAVAGILVLLRRTREEEERIPAFEADRGSVAGSESVRAVGLVLVPVIVLGYTSFRRVTPTPRFDLAEGVGVAGYPIVGALGLVAGATFLENVLPLGRPGDLLSAGTMPVLNLTVGLAVASGFVLIVSEFLEQTLALRVRGRG